MPTCQDEGIEGSVEQDGAPSNPRIVRRTGHESFGFAK